MIEFTVPGKPQGKARARICRTGHAYTPAKTVEYERAIKAVCVMELRRAGVDAAYGDVALSVIASYPIPKSATKREREEMLAGIRKPHVKPDVDNVFKAIADACNGVAYGDDKQIVTAQIFKRYAEQPGVKVIIREIGADERIMQGVV